MDEELEKNIARMNDLIEEVESLDCSLEDFYRILLRMRIALNERLECAEGDGVDIRELFG